MVTRTLIRVSSSPEASALAATTATSSSSAAAENKIGGGKKRAPSDGLFSSEEVKKRRRADRFVLDLNDVPPQPPLPKSAWYIKEGSSKYTGVSFAKSKNKWQAVIKIDGKQRHIGCYENEEEAAIDYARAVFKYKGGNSVDKMRERKRKKSATAIDLGDVPPQPPIPKGWMKEGASKYAGVSFHKQRNKWQATIKIDGKQRHIGSYENEEEAAIDYARAVLKYKGPGALDKARGQKRSGPAISIDLSDVPPQLPILKRADQVKRGASKYAGVYFHNPTKKWLAQIRIDGKQEHIGYYENEEEAAADYARAVFKYKGQEALDKAREQNKQSASAIDLSDVATQLPVPRSEIYIKEEASRYVGVTFDKKANKWQAQIRIDGMTRYIGSYENEEEAAINYARAVFKYKGEEALAKARKQNSSRSGPAFNIDLSDVPPQLPILRSAGRVKEGSSKYAGVYFNKSRNKWTAQIAMEGKVRYIGCYENEDEAAVDYARAVFKYKGHDTLDTSEPSSVTNDLSGSAAKSTSSTQK